MLFIPFLLIIFGAKISWDSTFDPFEFHRTVPTVPYNIRLLILPSSFPCRFTFPFPLLSPLIPSIPFPSFPSLWGPTPTPTSNPAKGLGSVVRKLALPSQFSVTKKAGAATDRQRCLQYSPEIFSQRHVLSQSLRLRTY